MDSNTATQASEQAAQAGDVPTSQEGQTVSVARTEPPVAKEAPEPEQTDSAAPNKDAKDWRKSDKEWQESQEKAKEADTLKEKVQTKEQEEKSLREEVEALKQLNARKDWEADNPIVRQEKYREVWDNLLKEKGDLIRTGRLTFDEAFKLISKEDTTALRQTFADQARISEGSVPSTSRSVPAQSGPDPATLEMGRYWGNKPEDFTKYGVR